MMDFTEYTENGAMLCPCCEDNSISSDGFDFETMDTLRADYSCDSCGASWSENYRMHGITINDSGNAEGA